MKRREFLKTTALATAAVAAGPLPARANPAKPIIRQYRQVGKTDIKMSDISFGTGKLPSSSMVLRAIDRGMNYFDTAPDYGRSERYIGGAMSRIQRDKIYIASKFCTSPTYPSHLPLGSRKGDYIRAVEGSLTRMKTDYLDVCFVHAIGEMSKERQAEKKRLLDPEMLAAVEALKTDGKIRYLAISSHGPDNMEDLLLDAVRSGHYDAIMMAFNFMKFPRAPEVFKEAHQRGVGVIAMKTLAGAKDMSLDFQGAPFAPAAFKWVLNHPQVDGLVITIKSVKNLDLYLRASGEAPTAADLRVLDRYAARYGKRYCRTGCSQCESACPAGVPVATALRYQMYFQDYGMEKRAMQSYAALNRDARNCLTCETPHCTRSCPYGLPVQTLLRAAHDDLSFLV